MRLVHVLAAGLLLLGLAPLGGAEDESPEALLARADDMRRIQQDPEGALALYTAVAEMPDLSADVRGDALVGAARCHLDAKRPQLATKYLDRILVDESLSKEARDWARNEKARRVAAEAGSSGAVSTASAREQIEQMMEEQRARAREKVALAKEAFEGGRFNTARLLVFEALSLDSENAEATALLQEIEGQHPHASGLLRRLIQFVQTAQLEEYQRLVEKVERLYGDGQQAFNAKDYDVADRRFRDALTLLDGSDFISAGGAPNLDSLAELRVLVLQWLRETHDAGAKKGKTFEPEPPLPDVEARSGSIQRDFYGLLARIVTPHEQGEEPLKFYDFAPAPLKGSEARPLVVSDLLDGLTAAPSVSTLTRARWAERWIRRSIGARWTDPADPAAAATGRRTPRGARILTRFGSIVCAQHRKAEHRRIAELRASFAPTPPALVVDLHVFAAGSGGAVRASQALGASAGASESGTDVVIDRHLIGDCVRLISNKQGLTHLGKAQVRFDGQSAVQLDVTQRTAEHPVYREVEAPALTVPDRDARYGLWLDLYAEDMPAQPGTAAAASALSLHARVKHPADGLASHVVPKMGGVEAAFLRLPVMIEQRREADRKLPHFSTFLVLGLENPFPQTRADYPELLILLGTHREDTPTPDPPRVAATSRIVPEDAHVKEYPIGSLALEVLDDVVPAGWPRLRTIAEPVPILDRRRLRSAYLADLLASRAKLDQPEAGGASPLVVQEGRASGKLSPEEHLRLEEQVALLRSHENDLYTVRIDSAAVPKATWTAWSQRGGAGLSERGTLTASGDVRAALHEELRAIAANEGPFDTGRVIPARATQRVIHRKIRSHAITKDLRPRYLEGGRSRYTAVPGAAEDGLIVEVRPGTEERGANGLRSVTVRALAARLLRIESRPYPGATQAAAVYDVPIWHGVGDGAVAEREDSDLRDDDTSVFLPLAYPGDAEQVIVVEVSVRKVQ